ncbi:MAG: hypothetical protein A3K22_06200 [Deltaproteobacteria bacterium RBG_16_42_7]|nr:MAG: hypothetical protein A3K22_06200 [Deltaproteobacteria bacterium RBG_16_42_7]
MDFKKLSVFIIIAGLAIALIGGVYYGMNQPVMAKTIPDNAIPPGQYWDAFADNISRQGEARFENINRIRNRESAKQIIIVGVIVLIAGIVVLASAKKKGDGAS